MTEAGGAENGGAENGGVPMSSVAVTCSASPPGHSSTRPAHPPGAGRFGSSERVPQARRVARVSSVGSCSTGSVSSLGRAAKGCWSSFEVGFGPLLEASRRQVRRRQAGRAVHRCPVSNRAVGVVVRGRRPKHGGAGDRVGGRRGRPGPECVVCVSTRLACSSDPSVPRVGCRPSAGRRSDACRVSRRGRGSRPSSSCGPRAGDCWSVAGSAWGRTRRAERGWTARFPARGWPMDVVRAR